MKNLKDIILEKLIINKNIKINENYVDLGLPSKNLWCKYNFGGKKETDYGEYFTGKQAFVKKLYPECLPEKEDFEELYDNCDHKWIDNNGVKGQLFKSKNNGESLFFPAAGYKDGKKIRFDNDEGFYWSSTIKSDVEVYDMYIQKKMVKPSNTNSINNKFTIRTIIKYK